jgi:integrase
MAHDGGVVDMAKTRQGSWEAKAEALLEGVAVGKRKRLEQGVYVRKLASGDVVLEVGWRDTVGRQKFRTIKGGLTTAREELADELGKRKRGEQTEADPRLTFNRAADLWAENRLPRLRTNTQASYKASLAHLRPEFGPLRLSQISPDHVVAYVGKREAQGAKGWTIKGEFTVISAIYTYAARFHGYPGLPPTRGLDDFERPNTRDARDPVILEPEQRAMLMGQFQPEHRLMFDLYVQTGLRRSELLGLSWGDVNFGAGTLAIAAQIDKRTRERVPLKTDQSEDVLEVSPAMLARLRARKVAAKHSRPGDLVFPGEGGKGRHPDSITKLFQRAAERAGLLLHEQSGRQVRLHLHDLRAMHGSDLAEDRRFTPAEIQARLRHGSMDTTSRFYVKIRRSMGATQERANRLGDLYDTPVEPTPDDAPVVVQFKSAEAS